MRSDCTGCKWISDEIEQRKELITEFRIRGDYKIALEEGSNMIRIGSLLFGSR